MFTVAYIKEDRLATTLVWEDEEIAKLFMCNIVSKHPQLSSSLHIISIDTSLLKFKNTSNKGEFQIIAH